MKIFDMVNSCENVSNPFEGVAGSMFDVLRGNTYSGYVLEGDLWSAEEREALNQFCKSRFYEIIQVRNAQFVLCKDEQTYSAFKRSWECPPIMDGEFNEFLAKLLKYEPEPLFDVDASAAEMNLDNF